MDGWDGLMSEEGGRSVVRVLDFGVDMEDSGIGKMGL